MQLVYVNTHIETKRLFHHTQMGKQPNANEPDLDALFRQVMSFQVHTIFVLLLLHRC